MWFPMIKLHTRCIHFMMAYDVSYRENTIFAVVMVERLSSSFPTIMLRVPGLLYSICTWFDSGSDDPVHFSPSHIGLQIKQKSECIII